MQPVTLAQALSFRLARQHLSSPAPTALDAAGSLIGAQAQVHSAAILQLRARSATGTEPAAIAASLNEGRELVKLWAQRSTLHLMPAADLPMLFGVRRLQVAGYQQWYQREGLSPAQVDILVEAVAAALREQGPHSRMELSRRLVPQLGDWARPMLEHSWGGIIKLACALGYLCHGPAIGTAALEADMETSREARFVHLDRWLPGGRPPVMESPAAVAALLRRYLVSFGPAGPADFRKFSGLPAGPVHQAFADLGPDLVPVRLGEKATFILADDLEDLLAAEPAPGEITVLPLFDPWLLAHQDTGQYLDDRHRPAIYRTAGWISPVVLRQGRVIAHWRHKLVTDRRTGTGWQVELVPLEKVYQKELPAIRRGLRRLSGGLPVTLAAM